MRASGRTTSAASFHVAIVSGAGHPRPPLRPRLRHPHDIKTLARDVMQHRIIISYEADAKGLSDDDLLQRILDHIPVP